MTTKARGAEEFVPADADLATLQEAAASCRVCELYKSATQTVFGDGDPSARIMLLGEKPGDREDKEGEPFVGPAGRLLAKALEEVRTHRTGGRGLPGRHGGQGHLRVVVPDHPAAG